MARTVRGGGSVDGWMAELKLKTLPGVFSDPALLAVIIRTEVSAPGGLSPVFITGEKHSNDV